MSEDQLRIAVAKACGVTPKRMWRVWYDAERQHGSIQIPTEAEAFSRLEFEIKSAPNWGGDTSQFSKPEEYDEWCDAPDYTEDLNAMHEAEKALTHEQRPLYNSALFAVIEPEDADSNNWYGDFQLWAFQHATALQRARAFVKTMEAK